MSERVLVVEDVLNAEIPCDPPGSPLRLRSWLVMSVEAAEFERLNRMTYADMFSESLEDKHE